MLIKKKQLLTATLLIALSAAVAVNWYYTNNPIVSDGNSEEYSIGDTLLVAGTVNSDTSSDDMNITENNESGDIYFSEAKLKRSRSHDEIIEEIEDFIEDESLVAEEKAEVSAMLSEFKDNVKKETDIENLINAKTSGEVLVVINGDSGSIVVEKGTLNDNLIMQITDIFEKNTGISPENFTIIEAK